MKNTYIIKHQGKTYISHNIMLSNFREKINQGYKVTDYIAFGSGTGTPSVINYSLFSPISVKPAKIIEYNADWTKGDYYVLRKIVLDENEFVGQGITELGFCADLNGNLITHSMLPQKVYKGSEPMEITAYFYFPFSEVFVQGDNPLIKVFLGIEALDYDAFTYGYCDYHSIEDLQNITKRYPCIFPNHNTFRLICPHQQDAKNIIIFYKGEPVIISSATYSKIQDAVLTCTFDDKARIEIVNFIKKEITSLKINDVMAHFSMHAKIKAVSAKTHTRCLHLDLSKIFVSKDRQFLLSVKNNEIEVFKDFLGTLKFIGKITLPARVSLLDMCAGKIAVVCNQSDTLLGHDKKRLYFFDVSNGGIVEKTFQNDLECDIELMSLEYAGGKNMVLYYFSHGILKGQTFGYMDQSPILTDNCTIEAENTQFLGTSYRRNTLFATNYKKDDLNGTVHKALLNADANPLYSQIILTLKSISPDRMYYIGEAIVAFSDKDKKVAVYSYVSEKLDIFDLNKYVSNIDKVFLDTRYIIITDSANVFYLYEIDYDLCEISLITQGNAPFLLEQAFVMNDIIVFRQGNVLEIAPVIYTDIEILSDQSAYQTDANIRFCNILQGSQTGYNSFSVLLTFSF